MMYQGYHRRDAGIPDEQKVIYTAKARGFKPRAFFGLLVVIQHQFQCRPDGLPTHILTAALKMMLHGKGFPLIAKTDTDCSHWVSEFISAGSGQAGNGNSHICLQQFPGTNSHFLCCLQ